MSIKSKTPLIISERTCSEAFITLMRCKPKDLAIEVTDENECAFVVYKQKPYRIHTRHSLFEDVKDMLTDQDQAQHIDLTIWLDASTGILSNSQFYLNLIDALTDVEQFSVLHTSLGISSFAPNVEEVFWNTLWNLDKTGLVFGNAIVAAAKTCDLDRLSDDILNGQIVNGHTIYNQFVDGIFEEVSLVKNKEELLFYIFSADGGNFTT